MRRRRGRNSTATRRVAATTARSELAQRPNAQPLQRDDASNKEGEQQTDQRCIGQDVASESLQARVPDLPVGTWCHQIGGGRSLTLDVVWVVLVAVMGFFACPLAYHQELFALLIGSNVNHCSGEEIAFGNQLSPSRQKNVSIDPFHLLALFRASTGAKSS